MEGQYRRIGQERLAILAGRQARMARWKVELNMFQALRKLQSFLFMLQLLLLVMGGGCDGDDERKIEQRLSCCCLQISIFVVHTMNELD